MKIEINLDTEAEEKKVFDVIRQLLIEQFQEFSFEITGTEFTYSHLKQKIE